MSSEIVQVSVCVPEETRQEAQNDEMLIDLWLHGRSPSTIRAYRSDAARFLAFMHKALREVKLCDIQSFADSLDIGLAPASKHRCLSAVKSLFSFSHRLGYLRFDVARPLRLPVLRDRLAERILTEEEVRRMISKERHPRNHALLCLLYASGVRVSELCNLRWRDLQERDGACGQITVLGKGGKTNSIMIPATVWQRLMILRTTGSDAAVFRSRRGRPLHQTHVRRIVRRAARRAGIDKPVSPHWLRHASAPHALDNGAGIHLVQATLGHSNLASTSRYTHSRPSESSGSYLRI